MGTRGGFKLDHLNWVSIRMIYGDGGRVFDMGHFHLVVIYMIYGD